MRLAIAIAVVLAGCKGSYTVSCDSDSFCVSGVLHGRCVAAPSSGARYCAFGDVDCPSGLRFDPTAGDDLGGQCLPLPDGGNPLPDGGGGPDLQTPGGLSFNVAPVYPTGASPSAVAFVDLDDNTFNDLVVADSTAGTIRVFLANPDGTLRAGVDYMVGHDPEGIVGGDFDGDGHGDLAVTLAGDNVVAILAGKGDGTLAAPKTLPCGGKPGPILAIDLTSDGKPDLVTANPSNDTLSVLLDNGDGTFKAAVTIATMPRPAALARGDLNRDGIIDLAVATQGGVDVFLTKGDGTFLATLHNPSAGDTEGVAIGEVTGDDKPDLIAFSTGGVHLEVAPGNGDGSCAEFLEAMSISVVALAAGDFDRDGRTDAAMLTAPSGGDLSVSLQSSLHAFGNPVSYGVGGMPSAIAIGDANSDGKLDLAVLSPTARTATLLLGRGDGSFLAPALRDNNSGDVALAVGPVDGDALPDVVYVTSSGELVTISDLSDGHLGPGNVSNAGAGVVAMILADFDLDKKLDACVSIPVNQQAFCLHGVGDGTFTSGPKLTVGAGAVVFAAGDFTGDGHPDLVVGNSADDNVDLLPGDGLFNFGAASPYAIGGAVVDLAVADFNGDGLLDVAVAASNGVSLLLGGPKGLVLNGTFPAGSSPQKLVAAKLDGDATVDVAVIDGADTLQFLRGMGTGALGTAVATPAGGAKPVDLVAADFDHDGKIDLATANSADPTFAAGTSVYLGHGDGTFASPRSFPVTHGATAKIATADFNSDGKPDLALMSAGKSTGVTVLLNTTP